MHVSATSGCDDDMLERKGQESVIVLLTGMNGGGKGTACAETTRASSNEFYGGLPWENAFLCESNC